MRRQLKKCSSMALAAGFVLAMPLTLVPSTPAQAEEAVSPVAAPKADPDKVLIADSSAPGTYRFPVPVPEGGQLRALVDESGDMTEVLVEDSEGTVVGAYDQAWAQDSAGEYVPTSYRIEGDSLVQTVQLEEATSFPVVIDPLYSAVSPQSGPTPAFVDVPSHYVYNPALGARHDYCTNSPDQFPNPAGSNADFRGPCARHDLCYDDGTISKFTCDNRLLAHMYENCEHEYAWYNPTRPVCKETAEVYWAVVVVA